MREHDKLPSLSELVEVIGVPIDGWRHQCHMISIKIVKSGVVKGRVARGTCIGVAGQHSWVVLGNDCYDPDVALLDPTIWSYQNREPYLWSGSYHDGLHRPHGHGSIWEWGRPAAGDGPAIRLTPKTPLSREALHFLQACGPLDRKGWGALASHAPVEGWPAAEIFSAMADTKAVAALIPIDRLGMLTDRNPQGLYLAPDHAGAS